MVRKVLLLQSLPSFPCLRNAHPLDFEDSRPRPVAAASNHQPSLLTNNESNTFFVSSLIFRTLEFRETTFGLPFLSSNNGFCFNLAGPKSSSGSFSFGIGRSSMVES